VANDQNLLDDLNRNQTDKRTETGGTISTQA
jgi:hypothetical protein